MRCLIYVLFTAWLAIQPARAQVTLNFVNAEVDQVAKAIGAATQQTIIVDPRVKGRLNLVSEHSVTAAQALKTLQSALRMQGFALVQDHGVLKVVPEADAKQQGVPVYIGNKPQAKGDQVITQVFQLRHEAASSLVPVLRPLISANNAITAYPANNTLVVTDYADNVRRIANIITGIDMAGRKIEVVTLKNANALDLAAQLQKILDPAPIGGTDATLKMSVLADVRTNSLILRAASPARMKAAKELIAKLDAPTQELGNIHVVPLRNADAVELAKTLRGILGEKGGGASTANSALDSFNSSGGFGGATGGVMPPLPTGKGSGTARGPAGAQANSSLGNVFGNAPNSGAGAGDGSGGGMVQANAATNSLVITASEPVYRNLRRVIDQLDTRRAQVYIESLIVEVSSIDMARFGIQWQALLNMDGTNAVFGGANYTTDNEAGTNIVKLATSPYAAAKDPRQSLVYPAEGLNIGYLRNYGKFLGLGGLLQALNSLGNTNVLSTPTMVTLDNEEAKIVVGQNVPILTGAYPQTVGTSQSINPFQTFERQDVGVTLHVKPKITEGGVIQLQIYQEDSGVVQNSLNSAAGVTLHKRAIQSTVLADDGQIIVLGGLLQDKYSDGNSKVPWLGNIPVLGALFRYENKKRDKNNLMVFLRPVIIRNSQDAQRVSLDRYDYMRSQTANFGSDNWLMRDQNTPLMPSAPLPLDQGGTALPALAPQSRNALPPVKQDQGPGLAAPPNARWLNAIPGMEDEPGMRP
ncbi:General secretion pathway protein D [Mycoavidus cysteinexigens]|uniref:General secretion pathway protein D n=1 Tax=Mycoavidus cysteinexigens TaxID=1553431 RepID=A0A2Z6ES36_9BURK|nr:type II secretion system secretin GspD [Mycoavidus cysteinexigens]BBE08216.1 General secretion pathway protein D [Mycoavidus cysteinexigens]GAM53077.1 general secretion pathway protein D [bacterium endosymbiont of Mortierella elongata FMR23-6]GLR02010.1 type II secretion system protein GspD [Mycoavidus cysteinexigens]